ncbi:MAG TPA: hypothetical protein VEZ14_00145 [Dehalococcoidia bacterium]|nr:hypothetical protein [Dehalococcoidia bacterium]
MNSTSPLHDRETQLLQEVGGLSDRVRALRAHSASANGAQIKALELQVRSKWAELRTLRATPNGLPPTTTGKGIWG